MKPPPLNKRSDVDAPCRGCGKKPSMRISTSSGFRLWVVRDYRCVGDCPEFLRRMREAIVR